jgi:hypothetical protein
LHKHEKNATIARFYYKLEASTIASSCPKLTNARLSRPSLILEDNELEFNLEYLRFAF